MKRRAESLALNKLIIIVLVILVILAVLMFVFRAEVLEWFRNLPGYTYNETDREVEASELTDVQVAGMCPENSKGIGFIGELEGTLGFREQYMHFLIKDNNYLRTKLYWRGTNQEAKIWLLKNDSVFGFDWLAGDLEVAKVEKGVILVDEQFLDLDSEVHQRARFNKEKSIELRQLLEFARILHNSYTVGNNKICKIADDAEYKPAWPESEGKSLTEIEAALELKRYWATFYLGRPKQVKIDLSPYIIAKGVEYFYIHDREDYFEIAGHKGTFNYWELGRIYPDGSVWISEEKMKQKIFNQELAELNTGEEFFYHENKYYQDYLETNLRLNYGLLKANYENLKK